MIGFAIVGATRAAADFIIDSPRLLANAADCGIALASLADTACCVLLGADSDTGRRLSAFAADRLDDSGPGRPGLLTGPGALQSAWLLGSLAHQTCFDDCATYGAAGAPVWAALLSLRETEHGIEDEDLLDAFVIGVRFAIALFAASNYAEPERGIDGTSIFGTMAATAACARLFRLDADQIASALAIAASELCGVQSNVTTDAEALHAGLAARHAVQATTLARMGFFGAHDILDARQGLAEAYFGLANRELSTLAAELAAPSRLAESVLLRRYPCHRDHQPFLEAICAAWDSAGQGFGDVDSVTVTNVPSISNGVRFDRPGSGAQARASLRYTAACAVTRGRVEPGDFDDSQVGSGAMVTAMSKTTVSLLPRWAGSYENPELNVPSVRIRTGGRDVDLEPTGEGRLALTPSAVADKWSAVAKADRAAASSTDRSMGAVLASLGTPLGDGVVGAVLTALSGTALAE